MKILVFLIIFVFALSLFRMILEWSKNNNKCSHQRYKRLENNDLYRKSKLFSQNGLGFHFLLLQISYNCNTEFNV